MEKVLETSAYKWTKASIHAFGSTVLEEGKRDNKRNRAYENSVFPEKKIRLKIYLFIYFSVAWKCWWALLFFQAFWKLKEVGGTFLG